MLRIEEDQIRQQTERYYNEVYSSLITSVKYDDFIRYAMNKKYPNHRNSETKIIKFPKSLDQIIKKDIEPAMIVEVPPMFLMGDIPLWAGSTKKNIDFTGMAFERGDRSLMANLGLGDAYPHGAIAGSSGSGKTVTVNSIAVTAAIEYGPWALSYKMVDAKITEFLNYSKSGILPHIEVIGATADADYIISMLSSAVHEMKQRLAAFSIAAGVTNIEEFNNVTGLSMPRTLIIIEEFGAMFMQAAKKVPLIQKYIDILAAQGRSAGIHLLLCSQQITSDIPDSVLNNMIFRGCLGATKSVSERIIKNDAASEFYGQKGKLYVNVNSEADKPAEHNKLFYTPFLPTDPNKDQKGMHDYKQAIEESWASITDYKPYNFKVFNESIILSEKEFAEFLAELPARRNKFYLGEPAFVQFWEELPVLPITLEEAKGQNINIYSPNKEKNLQLTKLIFHNLEYMKKTNQDIGIIYYETDKIKANKIKGQFGNIIDLCSRIESYQGALETNLKSALKRKICFEVDERLIEDISYGDTEIDEMYLDLFYQCYGEKSEHAKRRAQGIYRYVFSSPLQQELKIEGENDQKSIDQLMIDTATQYKNMPDKSAQFNISKLKKIYHIIDSMQELNGIAIGRSDARAQAELGSLIRRASEYGHHVITITTNMEEYNSNTKDSFDYHILYQLDPIKRNHVKGVGDYYPENTDESLAIVYQAQESNVERKALKFKMFDVAV